MKIDKYLNLTLKGFLGFLAGGVAGGFLGLVIGGTFLGWINFHELIGLEGYELSFYIGALFGSIVGLFLGINHKGKATKQKK